MLAVCQAGENMRESVHAYQEDSPYRTKLSGENLLT